MGSVIRLAFLAENTEFGSWRLACELDAGDGRSPVFVDLQ
jgi:hypothetical protein